MPSVMSLMAVEGPTRSSKRMAYPTLWPISWPTSLAIRSATVRAANRLGWVCPIMPFRPRPKAKQILGICVVFPDPVSPATIMTWCVRIASAMSSTRWVTGRSGGYVIVGSVAILRRIESVPLLSHERWRAGPGQIGLFSDDDETGAHQPR